MSQFDLFDEVSNKVLESKTYDEFRKALVESNCDKCSLSHGRHHIVVDRGNPSAKVVLVGEAPGENEDLEGRAFVGRAGKLMDQMMLDAGIDTNQDTLIINVVKCRPPENRPPKQEEVNSCIPFLRKQLEYVRPKVIVLLGATALKHVISGKADFSMTNEAGKFFEQPDYPGVSFFTLFHPAYILRDPRKKPLMQQHIQLLRDWLVKSS